MLSREQLSPIYRRLQSAGRGSTGRYQSQERRAGQESIAVGTNSDSYELRFPQRAEGAPRRCSPSGAIPAGTKVQIAYAIAGSSLEPVTVTRGFLYSVGSASSPLDEQGQGRRLAGHHPALRRPRARCRQRASGRAGGRHGSCRDHCTTAWPFSRETTAGVTLPTDSVRVGPTSAAGSSLSDLVLGSRPPISAGAVRRTTPCSSIRSAPTGGARRWSCTTRSRASSPAPYTVELTVKKKGSGGGIFKKIFGGGGAAIDSNSSSRPPRQRVSTHRSLKLDRLKPGNYVLELLVVDADGRRIIERRNFRWWRRKTVSGKE